ncbi:hypothetical protein GCM10009765_20160 [Fodinicola feengrottensis]|uniref:DUF302 domain-containing protein n=1 Tax=Fodinicola feengrottensis TaxID=435914 RepID=A0ABP4SF01_9ACTN
MHAKACCWVLLMVPDHSDSGGAVIVLSYQAVLQNDAHRVRMGLERDLVGLANIVAVQLQRQGST